MVLEDHLKTMIKNLLLRVFKKMTKERIIVKLQTLPDGD